MVAFSSLKLFKGENGQGSSLAFLSHSGDMSVRDQGFEVIRMSLGCLMQQMGLEDLSEAEFEQTPTRHLLRGLSIDRKNQVWRNEIWKIKLKIEVLDCFLIIISRFDQVFI